jgi:hypothetical protein
MKPAYFVVRILFGPDGEIIDGSEEIVSLVTDDSTIHEAEADYAFRKSNGKHGRDNLIAEAKLERKRRSIRPTVPEMPAIRTEIRYA